MEDAAWESSRLPGISLALSYISHFDVFRQHVTRIFTSDTDALEGGGADLGLTQRVCPHTSEHAAVVPSVIGAGP